MFSKICASENLWFKNYVGYSKIVLNIYYVGVGINTNGKLLLWEHYYFLTHEWISSRICILVSQKSYHKNILYAYS